MISSAASSRYVAGCLTPASNPISLLTASASSCSDSKYPNFIFPLGLLSLDQGYFIMVANVPYVKLAPLLSFCTCSFVTILRFCTLPSKYMKSFFCCSDNEFFSSESIASPLNHFPNQSRITVSP